MKIVIAPDTFKGSISSFNFCEIAEKSIMEIDPNIDVIKFPLGDGGEGTVRAMVNKLEGKIVEVNVLNPIGEKIVGEIGVIDGGRLIILEMASASGLDLIDEDDRDPFNTTTYGTGQLILKALEYNPEKIIVGLGGSATNDGGAGMLQALGFKLTNKNGENISYGAKGLLELEKIDISTRDKRLDDVEFIGACDVDNPLCGQFGAANIYAGQKGAAQEDIEKLDKALERFSKKITEYLNKEILSIKGAGAAGGLGAGLYAFLNAELKSGSDILIELLKIEDVFKNNKIDYVITGEGEINYQTLNGKLPYKIAKLAKKYDSKVIAIVGQVGKGGYLIEEGLFDGIFSIIDGIMTEKEAKMRANKLLVYSIKNIISLIREEK